MLPFFYHTEMNNTIPLPDPPTDQRLALPLPPDYPPNKEQVIASVSYLTMLGSAPSPLISI
jgi:hypothetical protein